MMILLLGNVQNRQIERQEVDWWLPGTGGGGGGSELEVSAHEHGVSYKGHENVLESDGGDGCTIY